MVILVFEYLNNLTVLRVEEIILCSKILQFEPSYYISMIILILIVLKIYKSCSKKFKKVQTFFCG